MIKLFKFDKNSNRNIFCCCLGFFLLFYILRMSLIVFILLNISLSFAIDSSLKFAQVGSNLTLDCPCQSYPCDTINWKFNSVVIQNNSTDFIIFNKNITSFLNIKSLTVNASNTEEFTAFVFQSGAAEKPLCRISVHLYGR